MDLIQRVTVVSNFCLYEVHFFNEVKSSDQEGKGSFHAESKVIEHPSVHSLCALIYIPQSPLVRFLYPTYNYCCPLFKFLFFSCHFMSDIALIILAVINVRNHSVINQSLSFKYLLVIYGHINVITGYRINKDSFNV